MDHPKTHSTHGEKILCAAFLEAARRFYQDPKNEAAFQRWCAGKGENAHGQKTAMKLRKEYPNYVPVKVAAVYLGVSARQLSWLEAERRQFYASIGGNIGINHKYVRIYTEPLIALLSEQGDCWQGHALRGRPAAFLKAAGLPTFLSEEDNEIT